MGVALRSKWLDFVPKGGGDLTDKTAKSPPSVSFVSKSTPSVSFVSALPPPPGYQVGPPAPLACLACKGADFWQGSPIHYTDGTTGPGALVCRKCHPPAPQSELRKGR
jgi:hypothetical protein